MSPGVQRGATVALRCRPVTEVPEHLLQRSRERRAALGLGGDAGEAAEGSAPAPATAAAAAPAGGEVAAAEVAAAALPAPVITAPPRPPVPKTRIPSWVLPVLVSLPVWGFFYVGAFGGRTEAGHASPAEQAPALYASSCASCHGAAGGGGVGPKLSGGDVAKTFPDIADHVAWIKGGSASVGVGNPYGDPARGRVAK